MEKYLIAFSGKPNDKFLDQLRIIAKDAGVDLRGAIVRPGPGCYNMGLLMESNERFVNTLALALMPAKWSTTADDIPEGVFVLES